MLKGSLLTRLFESKCYRSLPRSRRKLAIESLEHRQLMALDLLNISAETTDNDLLVQFRSPQSAPLIGQSISGGTVRRQLTDDGWFEIDVHSGTTLSSALAMFQSRSDVIQVTPDFTIRSQAIPNDPSYSSLWGLNNNGSQGGLSTADINVEQAWDYSTTANITTAVIDTGVDYTHPDLAANIWNNSDEIAGNGIDDDRNGYVDDTRGWDFANNDNNPMDDNGHGTHVAGTIGAVGNNGVGVTGVAWTTSIMPLKFLDNEGAGALSDAIAAINYARVNGAKVINASWGGGGFSSALQSAISQFIASGGVFVAAAGNESSNNVTVPSYPANYPGVISVGASTRTDTLASFSNFGTNVDIVAPGQGIVSTLPGNRYGSLSGTSMAAPHVAGAIALLWSQNPSRTATQITDAIMSNTDNVLRGTTSQFGRINVGKAAVALRNGTTTPPTNPPPANVTRTYSLQGTPRINDATTRGSTVSSFAIDVPDNVTIADLDIVLNISHTYVSDLGIRLIAPDGTARTLVQRRGGSSDHIQVTFSDEATAAVTSLGTLRGTVRPEQTLSGFDGKNARGRWTLQVTDFARGDVGTLLSAQLVITTSGFASATSTRAANGIASGNIESTIQDWTRLLDSVWSNWNQWLGTTSGATPQVFPLAGEGEQRSPFAQCSPTQDRVDSTTPLNTSLSLSRLLGRLFRD
jgi:subtilisin family serine protease